VTSGVSLSWYGFIPVELPKGSSPATYSIDEQTPVNFLLKGLPASTTTTVYNQKFFETAQLTEGPHTLKAVFEGNNSTPLTLDYLIVQNGTLSSTSASVSSHATSSTPGSGVSGTSATLRSPTPVGAIVGGVIGGLALIVFVIFGFLFFRRLHKGAAHRKVSISTPEPFDYTPLDPPGATPNLSLSAGRSYSPTPFSTPQTTQMGTPVTYGAREYLYHASMPSITSSTELSQSIEPPSTSSDVIIYPTNLRPVPLQQTALTIANPSFSSPPSSVSTSVPSPSPSKVDREAEALAALGPQRRGNPSLTPILVQGNDTRLANVVLHADSGIRRMPSSPSTNVLDVPPIYTPD
jgi:hypothetical protein